MKIIVFGLGLIGGSFALDMKRLFKNATVYGIDDSKKHLEEAKQRNIIDFEGRWDMLSQCDVVILATPVDTIAPIAFKVLPLVAAGTMVFDVGSTKHNICEALKKHPKRSQFVAAHPIAGTEFSGPKAAFEGLFQGKINILCDTELTAPDILERAEKLFHALGMSLKLMTSASHDLHIAYVSHLSHISSFMLGKTVITKEKDEQNIFDMAGSGFESTVRLAKSSPHTWTSIFKENKSFVSAALGEYISNLSNFKTLLDTEDYETLFKEMENTNRVKQILEHKKVM